jgi:hypothetical protein
MSVPTRRTQCAPQADAAGTLCARKSSNYKWKTVRNPILPSATCTSLHTSLLRCNQLKEFNIQKQQKKLNIAKTRATNRLPNSSIAIAIIVRNEAK